MSRRPLATTLGLCAGALFNPHAQAVEPVTLGAVSVQPQLESGLAFIDNTQQAFGAPTSFYGYDIDPSGARWEGYVKAGLGASVPLPEAFTLKAKFNVVSSANQGDSDGLGYTRGNPRDTDWDEAFLALSKQGGLGVFDSATLSAGRVPYMIGEGFLIGEGQGTVDQGHQGGYWINPRKAFDKAVLLQLDSGKLHADLFELQTRLDVDVADYQEQIKLKGVNLEYAHSSDTKLGATFFRVNDTSLPSRDGMKVSDLRLSGNPLAALPGLGLAGEYVWQENHGDDAHAWYLQTDYSFTNAWLSPKLTYRYSEFSDTYDSLLYGYGGDWGTWVQGEIVGESMLFNMNQKTSMAKLTLHPSATVTTGVAAFDFRFYRRPEGVSDDRFAQEVDLYLDWMPNEHWMLGTLYGYARPDTGAQQYFASDKSSNLLEAYVYYYF